jgi:hypothetical protein
MKAWDAKEYDNNKGRFARNKPILYSCFSEAEKLLFGMKLAKKPLLFFLWSIQRKHLSRE